MNGIQYRPSIDGMRALAVVSVLLFHLDKRILPGGFVGVDVFFVISGFLITSIVYGDTLSGRLSLTRFYQRRIARIFPVFFTVTFAILLASYFYFTSQDFASAGALATASVLSVTNLKLMLQGNYFEVSPDSQPFLHFWSLAVEEQFYLLLPLFMVMVKRLQLSRRTVLVTFYTVAAVSFLICLLLTMVRPTWAFYLLPARAWELLAGSILAVSTHGSVVSSSKGRGNTSLLGLCIVVSSFLLLVESNAFPGGIALIPVVGTVMLLSNSSDGHGLVNRLLSQRWVVFIGKLSYSLYLWHWPIFCFVNYRMFGEAASVRILVQLSLTLVFALCTYVAVEKPLRLYLNKVENKTIAFLGFAIVAAFFAVVGMSIRSNQYIDSSAGQVRGGGVHFRVAPNAQSVVLMGDSNGSMYATMMKSIANRLGVNLNVISVAAGDPLPATVLYKDSIDYLAQQKPDVTVFAASWESKLKQNHERLEVAIEAILRHSSYLILVTQPPVLPEIASREYFRENGVVAVIEDPVIGKQRQHINELLVSLRSRRVIVVEADHYFMNQKGEIFFTDSQGRQLFQDKTHLSGAGASLLEEPLSEVISSLLKENSP